MNFNLDTLQKRAKVEVTSFCNKHGNLLLQTGYTERCILTFANATEKSVVFQPHMTILPTKMQEQRLILMTKQDNPASMRMAVGIWISPRFSFTILIVRLVERASKTHKSTCIQRSVRYFSPEQVRTPCRLHYLAYMHAMLCLKRKKAFRNTTDRKLLIASLF